MPAPGDVEELQPPADREHRQAALVRGARERELERIERPLGRAELCTLLAAVRGGVEVGATREAHAVHPFQQRFERCRRCRRRHDHRHAPGELDRPRVAHPERQLALAGIALCGGDGGRRVPDLGGRHRDERRAATVAEEPHRRRHSDPRSRAGHWGGDRVGDLGARVAPLVRPAVAARSPHRVGRGLGARRYVHAQEHGSRLTTGARGPPLHRANVWPCHIARASNRVADRKRRDAARHGSVSGSQLTGNRRRQCVLRSLA